MIQRFYVHNFRCLENFELPISGKSSSLLIGKNGSGKSTVGAVLGILQSIARGTSRIRDLVTPKDFSRGRSDVPIRFEIEVAIDGVVYQYILAFEFPEGFRDLRIAEERFSHDGKDVYSRDRAQVFLTRTSTDQEAKFMVDWHHVALTMIQEQSEKDPLYIFKNWLAQMLIIAPIPGQMTGDSTGDTLMPDRDVANFGEWLSGLLAHSPAVYTTISQYLKDVFPDFKEFKNPLIGKNSRSLSVQFQQEQALLSLPFEELSDGEKCFFVSALVLASRQVFPSTFCFWDEPDSFLSLSEVGHFVMELRRSFQSGGQFVTTSHNPEAIRQFSYENTFLMYRRSHLEPSQVRPVSDLEVKGDLVNALIRDDVEP